MASAKYYVSWTRFYEPHCILINVSINPNVSMFRSLKEEEDFVDVTLSCEESQYQAHKVVLSACSPYFRKLLKVITLHICYTFTVLLTLARVQLQNYYLFRFYDLILFTSSPTIVKALPANVSQGDDLLDNLKIFKLESMIIKENKRKLYQRPFFEIVLLTSLTVSEI